MVKTNADTLFGDIQFTGSSSVFESVKIKVDGKFQTFKSYQIASCQVDGTAYQAIRHNGKHRIMKVVVPGYLSYFRFRDEDSFEFGSHFLAKKNQEGLEVSAIGFKKRVSEYLSDCPEIERAVINKEYKFLAIKKLVADYNQQCTSDSKIFSTSDSEDEPKFQELKELQFALSEVFNKKSNNEPIPTAIKKKLEALSEKDLASKLDELLKSLD